MTPLSSREWVLKAQSPIWTGDADRNGGRTVPTGLLGSLRWWFEVLVRGLGGSACDPADSGGRCPDKNDKHCVVCELFGCTGWARKFRFEILNGNGEVKVAQIKKDQTFMLRFTPLRAIRPQEWALLDLTLRLAAEYGAIGGKTKIRKRDDRIGRPPASGLGQVRVENDPNDLARPTWQQISAHLKQDRWCRPKQKGFEWAAAGKLEALAKKCRTAQDLFEHLRNHSGGGTR